MKNHHDTKHGQTPEELIEQINELMTEAEALLAGPTVSKGTNRLHNIYDQLGKAKEKLTDVYGDARKKVIHGAKATDSAIRSHPYESLAVAVGVGVLIGYLVRRNRA